MVIDKIQIIDVYISFLRLKNHPKNLQNKTRASFINETL